MTFVFDLDGTLVDTKRATTRAYWLAGVIMPQEACGKPWQDWLPQLVSPSRVEQVRRVKRERYASVLEMYATELPLLRHAIAMRSPVITGACAESVSAVKRRFMADLNVQALGLNFQEKARWLRESGLPIGYYVDDDEDCRRVVKLETSWLCLSPREALALLSSPLAPIPA